MENMKKTGKFDIDIEIKDLLWEFARRWRLIIIMAVVCGLALGAYQYRADMNKTEVKSVKKSQEELEKAMGEQDLDEVTAAVAMKRQLDQKSLYMEESILMRVNPFEENAVYLQYFIDAEDVELARSISEAYVAYVENGTVAQHMIADGSYDVKPMYIAELISIVKEDDNAYVSGKDKSQNISVNVPSEKKESSFSVKVIGENFEMAETLATEVKAALEEYSTKEVAVIGEHQLKLIAENSSVFADQALAELQNWNATSIKNISNNLDSMKNEMTGDQISLYVYRTTVLAEENAMPSTNDTVVKVATVSMKHIVIGAIVGVILACGIIFVLYLFAAKLRNSEEIKTLYSIKVLGCVDGTKFQKKKLFGFVDAIIKKLENGNKKTLTYDQEIQMICANVVLDCQKQGTKEVFLTSSTEETLPKEVVEIIVSKCKEKDICVTTGTAITYDAKALENAAKIGHVVFIEKERVSFYDELYSEIALCQEHGIHVAGMVVIG